MGLTGRNDLCPCGSGLKYKKCCLFKGAKNSIDEIYFPPIYSDNPTYFGTIKKIPSYKEYNEIKCDEIVYAKFKEIINNNELSEYLGFNEENKRRFLKIIKTICKHNIRTFDIHIQDTEQFK